jgi:hypothetical protein
VVIPNPLIVSKWLLILCFCFFANAYPAESYFKDKFQQAHAGDYIVTTQENAYSLLLLRSINPDILTLEEITIPSVQVNPKSIDWKKWLSEKAPGHTAWTLYEIDLKQGVLLECFSYSKNGWVYLEDQEQFFAKLLALPLFLVPDSEKKRIGPPPQSGESDHRKIWSPTLVIEGKKIAQPLFDVLRTRWPEDSSPLSLCPIDLYFDHSHPSFPFPYWIDVKSPHYAFKVRAVDSGHGLISPMKKEMPRRPPEIVKATEKSATVWTIYLQAPLYHDQLHLFAIDMNSAARTSIEIPHRMERTDKTEQLRLCINTQELKKILQPDHRYQWAILSDKTPSVYVKSEETFTWK